MKPKCEITSAEANVPDLRSRFAQHTPKAVEKNGPCGSCRNKKTLFSGVDFAQFSLVFTRRWPVFTRKQAKR
jgi:hypothetical protein